MAQQIIFIEKNKNFVIKFYKFLTYDYFIIDWKIVKADP